jgi:four helix bundle protein
METMNQLILADDMGYVPEEMMVKLRLDVAEIARMLTALKKKVECGASKGDLMDF